MSNVNSNGVPVDQEGAPLEANLFSNVPFAISDSVARELFSKTELKNLCPHLESEKVCETLKSSSGGFQWKM